MTSTATRSTALMSRPVDDPLAGRLTAAPAPRTSSVRLTRRGRLVVLVALVTLLLTAFSLGRVGSRASTDAPTAAPLASTTVHQGESLWMVAKRVAPGQDPRVVVERLRELNHLDSGAVLAGQQLLLPRGA